MALPSVLMLATERSLSDDELAQLNSGDRGFDRTLGLRYIHVGSDRVTAELDVSTAHLQPAGIVNGGVYSSLAESAGSLLAWIAAGGVAVAGVNNSTDFISAVSEGTMTATATMIHNGRTSQLISIVCEHDGRVVARSTLRTLRLTGISPHQPL